MIYGKMDNICHIIGNGYSRELFKDNEGIKIGLNYYGVKKVDILFAIDDIAIKHLENNNFYNTPTVINNTYETKNKNVIDRVDAHKKKLPFTLENYPKGSRFSFNAGHCAFLWAKKKGYEKIHMWGFDVLFNGSLLSLSDDLFGHSKEYKTNEKFVNKARYYIDIWNKIVDTPIYINMPTGQKLKTTNDNIIGVNV